MAEQVNLGEVSYDVSADTAQLLAAAKQVDTSTQKMGKSFDDLTKKIVGTEGGASKLAKQYGDARKATLNLVNEITRLGGSIQENGTVVDKYGVANQKVTRLLGHLRAAVAAQEQGNDKLASTFLQLTSSIAGTESGASRLAAKFGGSGAAAAALENDIRRLGGQVQANGTVVDNFGVRNAKLTAVLAQLRGATFQTTNSFRMMRGGMQQMGYQIQDIAVQLQMGTNPLMVLSQQGSQIASLFGTGGAVFGAILAISAAVGMSLIPSFFDSTKAADELEKSITSLKESISETDGIKDLSDDLKDLADISEVAAVAAIQSQLLKAQDAARQAGQAIVDAFDTLDADYGFSSISDYMNRVRDAYESSEGFAEVARELGESLGLVGNDAEKAGKQMLILLSQVKNAPTPERFLQLQESLAGFVAAGNASEDIVRLNGEIQKFFSQARTAAEISDFLNGKIENLSGGSVKAQKGYQDLVNELGKQAATVGMSARELDIYNVTQLATLAGQKELIPTLVAAVDTLHDQIDATNDATAAEKQRQQALDKGQSSLEDQIRQLAIKSETLGMDERQLAKHTAMQIINTSGIDVNTEAVMANIDAIYDRIEARVKEIDAEKDAKDAREDAIKAFDDYAKQLDKEMLKLASTTDQRKAFIDQIRATAVAAGKEGEEVEKLVQSWLKYFELQDKQTAAERVSEIEKEIQLQYLKNSLTEREFEIRSALMALGLQEGDPEAERITNLITQMQEAQFQAQLLGEDLRTAFQDIGVQGLDSLSQGLTKAIIQGDSLSDTLRNIGHTIAGEVLNSIIRYFIGQAAAKIMADKTAASSGAAALAVQTSAGVAAGSALAAAYTPAAIAASIATAGGAATAGAMAFTAATGIMGAALAASGSIQSAMGSIAGIGGGRLYGGRTEAGKLHPILEDGKPEMFTMGNRNYLMAPRSGMVTSNKDFGGSNVEVIHNVYNYAGVPVETRTRTESNGMSQREIIDTIVGDIKGYGRVHQAVTETTTATGRVR